MENAVDLKFPIGPFIKKVEYTSDELGLLVLDISDTLIAYKKHVDVLSGDDLLRTYRPGSWNVRQLVHHVADIQLLHFLRMKKAITEPEYNEVTLINMDGWANTLDGSTAPVQDSILMLEGITNRYIYLVKSLSEEQLRIQYYHPVKEFYISQVQAVAMSAWHMKHHLAHIELALQGV